MQPVLLSIEVRKQLKKRGIAHPVNALANPHNRCDSIIKSSQDALVPLPMNQTISSMLAQNPP